MIEPVTPATLRAWKAENRKAVGLSLYTAWEAQIAEQAGIDYIVVGDSAAMTLLGMASTIPAKLSEMLMFSTAVWRGAKRPLKIGDLPWGTFTTPERAIDTAVEFVRHGCGAVKIETVNPEIVHAVSEAGIAVMAHLGLLPQQRDRLGGFKTAGRTALEASRLVEQVAMMERAGADFVLLEAVPAIVAARCAIAVGIPVYGIGAGKAVDGQLLVASDVTGTYQPFKPRFAKKWIDGARLFRDAYASFAKEAREGTFPEPAHAYSMAEGEEQRWLEGKP